MASVRLTVPPEVYPASMVTLVVVSPSIVLETAPLFAIVPVSFLAFLPVLS